MLWLYTRGLLHVTPVPREPRTPLPSTYSTQTVYGTCDTAAITRKENGGITVLDESPPSCHNNLTLNDLHSHVAHFFSFLSVSPYTCLWFTHKQIRHVVVYTHKCKTKIRLEFLHALSILFCGLVVLHISLNLCVTLGSGSQFNLKQKRNCKACV